MKFFSAQLGNYSLLSSKHAAGAASSEILYSSSRSFIFYGKYDIAQNSQDKTGAQICDYPSLNNCRTHADGKGRGASAAMTSGLNPDSNVHII